MLLLLPPPLAILSTPQSDHDIAWKIQAWGPSWRRGKTRRWRRPAPGDRGAMEVDQIFRWFFNDFDVVWAILDVFYWVFLNICRRFLMIFGCLLMIFADCACFLTFLDDFWMIVGWFWTSFWPIDELWLMCSMILWLFFAPAFSLRFHFCGFVGTAPAPALFVEQNITKSYLWSRKKGGEV